VCSSRLSITALPASREFEIHVRGVAEDVFRLDGRAVLPDGPPGQDREKPSFIVVIVLSCLSFTYSTIPKHVVELPGILISRL
jgi:hypothetical protein